MSRDEGLVLKVVLLGDSGVGKTSLVIRYVKGTFQPFQEPTIGAAFLSHQETVEDIDTHVTFKLWDTAGQERYHSLTPLYFRGAHVALLVYDICRLHSFQTLQKWARDVQAYNPKILLVVVGNKSDLNSHRSVSVQAAKQFATSIQAVLYMETSAKDDVQVKDVFQQVARRGLQMIPEQQRQDKLLLLATEADGTAASSTLSLSPNNAEGSASNAGKCCV